MLCRVLKFINQHAASHYARKNVQYDPVDMIEVKAFVGILYLLAVNKESHENIRNLWSAGRLKRSIFKATMSVNRFENIRCRLRFDAINTLKKRRARDKFSSFRDVWNFFNLLQRKLQTISRSLHS